MINIHHDRAKRVALRPVIPFYTRVTPRHIRSRILKMNWWLLFQLHLDVVRPRFLKLRLIVTAKWLKLIRLSYIVDVLLKTFTLLTFMLMISRPHPRRSFVHRRENQFWIFPRYPTFLAVDWTLVVNIYLFKPTCLLKFWLTVLFALNDQLLAFTSIQDILCHP